MKKIYAVFHDYGTDGGFGDYVPISDLIMVFENREDAKAFCERFEKPHVYDKPYNALDCGNLSIRDIDIVQHENLNFDSIDTKDFWWLTNDVIE